MLEVKGSSSVIWYWSGFGVALSVLGWYALGWLEDLGKLGEILSVSMMLSGVILVGLGIWRALDKRPVLVVDEQGVLDRTGLPHRRIGWTDITAFRLIVVAGSLPVWLAIEVVDPEKFISKSLFVSRVMLETFHTNHATPCVISLKLLDAEPNALLLRLRAALSQYKR